MTLVVESLKAVFERNEVNLALVVDDAFMLTFEDLVDEQAWADFKSAAKQDEKIGSEIEAAGFSISDDSKNIDALSVLSGHREKFDLAIEPVSNLLALFDEKLRPIVEIVETLELCNIKVDRQEPSFIVPDDYKCDVAFVDFFLDDGDHPSTEDEIDASFLKRKSVVRSIEIASEVFKKSKAFVVLMSSYTDVKRIQDQYQTLSKALMKGFFSFTSKELLTDQMGVGESLIRLPLSKQLRTTVYNFANSVETSCANIVSSLSEAIRDLSVDDYAFLSHQLIQKESHPLGDYLLRLLGSHLVTELQKQPAVSASASELDKTFLQDELPMHEEPSKTLANLYSSHICEAISDDGENGWAGNPLYDSASENELSDLPFLRFGDLLTKNEKSKVYLVLNPGCDLMFGPKRTDRNLDDCIILLPGTLRELHEPIPSDRAPSAYTWLFQINEKKRRVEWDFRRFITIQHDNIKEKCQQLKYNRLHRMRSAEAISIQQQFLAHLGRVGTNSPPPIATWHDCNVYCKSNENLPVLVQNEQLESLLIGIHDRHGPGRKGDRLIVSGKGRSELRKIVWNWIDLEQAKVASEPMTDENKVKLERRDKFLQDMRERVDLWRLKFELDTLKDFPEGRSSGKGRNKEVTKTKDVLVCNSVNQESKWNGEHVVMLELLEVKK